MDRILPYSCYGVLVGGISRQAVFKSVQKQKDIHSWFKRRIRMYLVPQSVQSSSSWSQQLAVKTAHNQLIVLINKMINWVNVHKRKDTRGGKSWTPQMVAKALSVHIDGKYDVMDVMERYLNRCIDQLIKVKHLIDWMSESSATQYVLPPKVDNKPLVPDIPSDPWFGGAFDR